ncbi:MAG: S8 family serine peptidase, partial [Cyclobacteriaceae bacterium]|nr:S8 family serine peptidase [Cyclobacteriaceae bacterium]
IDLDHVDLNVDASRGFNAFASGRDGKSLDDGHGHGTHVAGTIAAIDNEVGVVGVAAGATVIPVKVLNSRGSGSYSGVIAGIDYVGANGEPGDVANMSLGGPASQALDEAVKDASERGINFCLAAGNDSDDANNYSPARANGSNIFTISAMDANDNWASFSNYANPPVDYCAPGVSIKSTWKGGGYNTISGTSMATPHAAGVLLLGEANIVDIVKVNGDPDGNPDPIIVH